MNRKICVSGPASYIYRCLLRLDASNLWGLFINRRLITLFIHYDPGKKKAEMAAVYLLGTRNLAAAQLY